MMKKDLKNLDNQAHPAVMTLPEEAPINRNKVLESWLQELEANLKSMWFLLDILMTRDNLSLNSWDQRKAN